MKMLKDILQQAEHDGVAVGHFNFSDLVAFNAIAATARALNQPVIVGVSEGERSFVGVRQAAALVRSVREEYGHSIFINADHTHSIVKAEERPKPASMKSFLMVRVFRWRKMLARQNWRSRQSNR